MIGLLLPGLFKALRDRIPWGSKENDGVDLFYEQWPLYQQWVATKARIGWWPLDAWHITDFLTLFCLAAYYVGPAQALIDVCVLLTGFTVFFHALLYKKPFDGVKAFFAKYFNKKQS